MKSRLCKYIFIGVITLATAIYSERVYSNVEAKDKSKSTITREEQVIMDDINERYYDDWRVDTYLNDKDELVIKLDHSGLEQAIAESFDETYVTVLMWKMDKDRAITTVTKDNKIIDSYVMVCSGEAFNKE